MRTLRPPARAAMLQIPPVGPQTSPVAVALFAVAAFLGALGQVLYKSGADRADGTAAGYLLNGRLLGGVACYVAVMVLFVAAYRRGGALTVLYPVYASTFAWAAVLAWMGGGAAVRPVHVAGMALLVGGMYLMGRP